tara:strand:- start:168 stop:365 length:198 start_codon:yes stop_codon:yes gene_type:complete
MADGGAAAAGAAKAAQRTGRGGLMEHEARMILNISKEATEAEVAEVTQPKYVPAPNIPDIPPHTC